VGLGYGGNLFGRLGIDLAGAVEAEELTERRLGFDDAVREEGEAVAGSKTLEERGISSGWHRLEVGGGGSIATWLAARLSPTTLRAKAIASF
jgi:hypothetical protein